MVEKESVDGLSPDVAAKIFEQVYAKLTDKIVEVYNTTIAVLEKAIDSGSADAPLGMAALMMYADLLHGGAYTAPIGQRPYYLSDSSTSPYMVAPADQNLGGISILGITTIPTDLEEILTDSNVPHVFPKLLSDESYGRVMVMMNQYLTVGLVKGVGTGLTTWVSAVKTAASIPSSIIPNPADLARSKQELDLAAVKQ